MTQVGRSGSFAGDEAYTEWRGKLVARLKTMFPKRDKPETYLCDALSAQPE